MLCCGLCSVWFGGAHIPHPPNGSSQALPWQPFNACTGYIQNPRYRGRCDGRTNAVNIMDGWNPAWTFIRKSVACGTSVFIDSLSSNRLSALQRRGRLVERYSRKKRKTTLSSSSSSAKSQLGYIILPFIPDGCIRQRCMGEATCCCTATLCYRYCSRERIRAPF